MRGALSLAAALSIPARVLQREEVLYLTFTTILAGLLVLALPLPWLLERLGFGSLADDAADRDARVEVLRAAVSRLDELDVPSDNGVRRLYESRLARSVRRDEQAIDEHIELRREVLAAERTALDQLERHGKISYSRARRIERQLDLEEAGLRR
jgi:CPA1 family monovalent cation:H+ antiporter